MRHSVTLSWYFGRQFVFWFLAALLGVMAVALLLDTLELLRRASGREAATVGAVLRMALLKAPGMVETMFPFAALFGGMIAFARLTKSHELTVARAAGVSVWQFLLPAVLAAAALGGIAVAALNPVASATTAEFETLENRVLRNPGRALSFSPGGLWIRERIEDGHSVLHARGVSDDGESLSGVSVFLFRGEDDFRSRVDAPSARLDAGHWALSDAMATAGDGTQEARAVYRLATDLTVDNIQDSFGSPSTVSFWELPGFIDVLENAGFSSTRHRLHWHALLASPLLLCAMVLVAAAVTLGPARRGGAVARICAGLFLGFLVYFVSDVAFALGLSSRVPPALAAWTPAVAAALLGATGLLHLEDG